MCNNTGLSNMPNKGKTAKVNNKITQCKRQCVIPAITAARDNFAPCMKNNKAIIPVVKALNPAAATPVQGIKLAASTTANNNKVMLSGKNRGLVIE